MASAEEDVREVIRGMRRRFGHLRGSAGWADMSEEMARAAETKHLSELSEEEYRHLAWHGFCWDRTREMVQYFLPRLAEDIVFGKGEPPVESGKVMEVLVDAGWKEWPEDERKLVEDLFGAWWRMVLESEPETRSMWVDWLPPKRRAAEVLPLLLAGGTDAGPLLERWLEDESRTALMQLIDFLVAQWYSVPEEKVEARNGVNKEVRERVVAFLKSERVREKVEGAILREDVRGELGKVQEAMDYLEWVGRGAHEGGCTPGGRC